MWKWNKYVPVATRRAEAKEKVEKLRKKGKVIYPVEIEGRTISKKFWGKKWCDHLETFSDYDNRLPRGRTYARNGSVCHLEINKGNVEAIVSGSSLYKVKIKVTALAKEKWEAIKNKSKGQVGTLLELLKGKLSDNVMAVVADHNTGLFPNEGEIHFSCDCPDWADMCKHVAAVLYGIGNRLDERPDLLFFLRDVDVNELISTKLETSLTESDSLLQGEDLSDIFGIDLEDSPKLESATKKEPIKLKKTKTRQIEDLTEITSMQVLRMRVKAGLTVGEFAAVLGVTTATIYSWENKEGVLNLRKPSLDVINAFLKKNGLHKQ